MSVYLGDAIGYLRTITDHRRMSMMDVPDNIGLAYDGFTDHMPIGMYYKWIEELVSYALLRTDIVVFTYNAIHDFAISSILYRVARPKQKIIWTWTFGQYQDEKLTASWRPIVILGDDLNYDGIRIASSRMNIGDKRAAGPRVPGNVWSYPRVTGNSPERRPWHVTQLPEAMMDRIIILTCMRTEKGRTVPIGDCLDLFAGSGTAGLSCKKLGVGYTGIEISRAYYEKLLDLKI